MTQRVSIAGIDGTGKTTVIHNARENRGFPGKLRAFRAPQYHEDPDAPFARLSLAVDELSVLGDLQKDPILKATALFLSITFYGDVERHFEEAYRPDFLLMERQALADSLTYSSFYRSQLTQPISRNAEKAIVAKIGDAAFAAIQDWLSVLAARSRHFEGRDFWTLPLALRELFSLQPPELIRELQSVYATRIPEQVVLLQVSETRLQERLAQKRGSGTAEELHEKREILQRLQAGLLQSCGFLKTLKPEMKLHLLDTSELSIDETLEKIFQLIRS